MKKLQQGFSLVELMVTLVITMVLMAGVAQIFIANKTSYNFSEQFSRSQESGRFATEFLTKSIRMAGYMPCQTTSIANVVNTGSDEVDNFTDIFTKPVEGYEVGASVPAGHWAEDALEDTHAIKLIFAGSDDDSYTITAHNPNSAQFTINKTHPFDDNDILLVCDPTHAAILQVTNANASNRTIVHNTGTGSPGNCTKGLGSPVPDPCTANGTSYTFDEGSQVLRITGVTFFIGDHFDADNNVDGRSLYRRTVTFDDSDGVETTTTELVQGVENLHFVYGVDLDKSDNDGRPSRFVDADYLNGSNAACTDADGATAQTCDWQYVTSVRMTLIAVSANDVANVNDTRDDIPANGEELSVPTGEEKKLRFVYPSTITLRNRML